MSEYVITEKDLDVIIEGISILERYANLVDKAPSFELNMATNIIAARIGGKDALKLLAQYRKRFKDEVRMISNLPPEKIRSLSEEKKKDLAAIVNLVKRRMN